MDNKELERKLQECGAIKFGNFVLASGKNSMYYIALEKAITKPKILEMICEYVIDEIVNCCPRADYVACVELGSVPIGTVVSVTTGIPLLIARKSQKDHGMKNRIMGDPEKNKTAILIEDVTTTGGSVIRAVQALRDEGLIVKTVISVVDRDEGAKEALVKEGLTLISLIRASDLLKKYEIAEAPKITLV